MPTIVIHNPATGSNDKGEEVPGKLAHFGWGGKQYEIKPGETQILEDHLAAHARKHNPHLQIMDESMGALSFAESQERMAGEKVARLSKELEAKTGEFKRAQQELIAARSKLKAEREIQAAEIKGLTTKE